MKLGATGREQPYRKGTLAYLRIFVEPDHALQECVEHFIATGGLTLGTDNGSAFTARAFKLALSALGIAHRRGGYRDPESQAFIESWFRYLKERCVWRHEFETLDQAREVIAAYIDNYHHRPHSGLDYKTPTEVAQTWDDALGEQQTQAA